MRTVCENANVQIGWIGRQTEFTLPAPWYKDIHGRVTGRVYDVSINAPCKTGSKQTSEGEEEETVIYTQTATKMSNWRNDEIPEILERAKITGMVLQNLPNPLFSFQRKQRKLPEIQRRSWCCWSS